MQLLTTLWGHTNVEGMLDIYGPQEGKITSRRLKRVYNGTYIAFLIELARLNAKNKIGALFFIPEYCRVDHHVTSH